MEQMFREDEGLVTANHGFFNPTTLCLMEDGKKLLSTGLRGEICLFELDFSIKPPLRLLKSVNLHKNILNVFASKMNKNLFFLRLGDQSFQIMNTELQVQKTHKIKGSGDIVLIENKSQVHKMEFMIANTNSIEDCISNQYLEETQNLYVKDYLYSSLSSRN